MKRSWVFAMVVGLAAIAAGCGTTGGPATGTGRSAAFRHAQKPQRLPTSKRKDLVISLDDWEGPAIAGIVMAEARNFFTEAGITIHTRVPTSPASSLPYLIHGTDDLAVSHEPEVMLAKASGAPIVMLGSLVSRPTAAMVWLKGSGIHSVAELKGKTIAIPGLRFQRLFLRRFLAQAGLTLRDVEVQKVGVRLTSALVSGRADATFGAPGSIEGPELEARGLEPVVIPVAGHGFPAYEELVLVAREDHVAREPGVFRAFLSALRRGTAAAVEDPQVVAWKLDELGESNPAAGLKAEEGGVQAMSPLLSMSGQIDPGRAANLVAWMVKQGMLKRRLSVSTLLADPSGGRTESQAP